MKVGVPKETLVNETRVAAVPDTVGRMTKAGVEVLVEAGAGAESYIKDEDYIKAGAKVIQNTEDLFRDAGVILKVQGPLMNGRAKKHEVDMMREGAVLIAFLQPMANLDIVMKLAARKVTAFSMDAVPRISRAQMMDALSSMATIAGYKAVLIAADSLKKFVPMLSTAAGTVYPAKTVIIGAGVAGLQAIATAKRLGSVVVAFDTRPAVGEQIKSLGGEFVPLDVPHDQQAEDAGGYAKEMSADFYKAEQEIIRKHTKDADVVISTALIPGRPAPTLITEEMVKEMKPGSVIVDLSVEQGGNCALSEKGKTVVRHNVTIIGPTNLPATLPVHASQLYARNVLNFLDLLAPDKKDIKLDLDDEIVKGSLITHNGEITGKNVAEAVKKANINFPSGSTTRSHW
ncbi:MAG: Re/Si-specific NAD(P)(+) transhydrogenase subunit alpha [Deltaproteobacteria bacterium]|nr:Re/Si-specific NAD(P)(+) transhydrogenase subunit alpha [Deltaproteobacteria bacterium]